jgi:hypothetical protein
MGPVRDNVGQVQIGDNLILVVQKDARPIWCRGPVVELSPLVVAVSAITAKDLASGDRVVLVRNTGRRHETANSTIADVELVQNVARVKLHDVAWDLLDNRSGTRREVDTRAILRLVAEDSNQVAIFDQIVLLKNISVGGAKIEQRGLTLGQLVELRVAFRPGHAIRLVGMIVRCSPDQAIAGLKFVDYVGNARAELERFVENRAA